MKVVAAAGNVPASPLNPRYTKAMESHGIGVSANLSPLEQWATQANELYQAMLRAGFSTTEAVALIVGMSQHHDAD